MLANRPAYDWFGFSFKDFKKAQLIAPVPSMSVERANEWGEGTDRLLSR